MGEYKDFGSETCIIITTLILTSFWYAGVGGRGKWGVSEGEGGWGGEGGIGKERSEAGVELLLVT